MDFKVRLCLVFTLLTVAPSAAQAHLVATQFGDFYSGMLHPLTALEHIVPWLALGLLAGLQGGVSGRWILLVFPFGVCLGTVLTWMLPPITLVSGINLASFIILGALVAFAWHLPTMLFLGLGTILGLTHGYANGLALSTTSPVPLFITGVTISSYIVIALVTASAITLTRRTPWGKVGVRAVGSWITAIGVMMVGLICFTP
jgi:hydrogenase/urease accessory protein HupE